MIQEKGHLLQERRTNMLFENGFNGQEGHLLEDAFLLSSSIEILTTKPKDRPNINQKELSIFIDLSDLIKKLQTADEFMSQEQIQLALQPEGVGLLTTVAALNKEGLSEPIRNALKTLDKITSDRQIPKGNQEEIKNLIWLLRKLLGGIKIRISQENDLTEY